MHKPVLALFVLLGALSWAYMVQLTWLKVNEALQETSQRY